MTISIGDAELGPDEPTYVIAEAGANHDGELEKAKRLIDAAVEAGADAVKFQNYSAGKLVTRDARKWWGDTSTAQYETYTKLDTLSRADNFDMAEHAAEAGIPFLSTPFNRDAVDLLEELEVPAYKLASGDLTNYPLLRHVARKDKPVILSTGMATLPEVREAVGVLEDAGNDQIVLLHCVSVYPTPVEDINLRMMETLMDAFDYPVGLSDHTEGVLVPVAAAAMGAAVIEKHFTFDTSLEKSPDHRLSADVKEMSEIVEKMRAVHAARGRPEKGPILPEMETRMKARRSLVTDRAFEAGEEISRSELSIKRPGTGIQPKHLDDVHGCTARTELDPDEVLTWHDVDVEY